MKHFSLLALWVAGLAGFSSVFADNLPNPVSLWLPFESYSGTSATQSVVLIIKESIKYVGILAMLSLSWWGMQFLISMGSDEKVKKAKSIVLYSLLGVILSITAYTIIDIVNSLKI